MLVTVQPAVHKPASTSGGVSSLGRCHPTRSSRQVIMFWRLFNLLSCSFNFTLIFMMSCRGWVNICDRCPTLRLKGKVLGLKTILTFPHVHLNNYQSLQFLLYIQRSLSNMRDWGQNPRPCAKMHFKVYFGQIKWISSKVSLFFRMKFPFFTYFPLQEDAHLIDLTQTA